MNASAPSVLIIGAGQAGSECATALRQNGFAGRVVLIGDEPHLPYRRPPLSKAFLSGEATSETLQLKPLAAYTRSSVECLIGVKALGIDRTHRRLELNDGRALNYDKLVLATGGRPRTLTMVSAGDAANVHYLRTIGDVERIHRDFLKGRRLVIIGGGYIGLEVAAVAVKCGLRVTVLESAPRVLVRVTSPEMSAFYEDVHRKAGVDIRTNAIIEGFQVENGRVTGVRLAESEPLPADLLVVGIGLVPNVELAQAAGLLIENGIVVDDNTRSADPDIFAIGDCSNQPSALYGRRLRLESVPNAVEQAQAAAAAITGKPRPRSAVPWFWSDQYDLKLQMAGLSQGYDQTVRRGDPDARAFTTFYLREGMIIAADAVNRPQDFMVAKQLIAAHVRPGTQDLADPALPLNRLLAPSTSSIPEQT